MEKGTLAKPTIKLGLQVYICLLVVLFAALFLFHIGEITQVIDHIWVFAPAGILAAIIANSTGTGGGVVFVPAFSALTGASQMGTIPMDIVLKPTNTIAISFAIQCFGMSVGAATWVYRFYGGGHIPQGERIDGHTFLSIVGTVLLTTLPALWITQFVLFGSVDGNTLLTAFKWLSLLLGIVLLVFTWVLRHMQPSRFVLSGNETYWLLAIGALGGVITAYFSVGVGELVVVYLLFRKFPTLSAIAIAVVITAITVLAGIGYHLAYDNVVWPIALIAIPGAMVGGYIARIFAIWLGTLWLKTFAALWIIASSGFLIIGPSLGWLPN